MGFEWHDRHRDQYGRFAAINPAMPVQIHIRMTAARAEAVRAAALAAHQDMGRYVADAIDARLLKDGHLTVSG